MNTTTPADPFTEAETPTINDGCPECGHWKEWDVVRAGDGNVYWLCYKCRSSFQPDADHLADALAVRGFTPADIPAAGPDDYAEYDGLPRS